MYKLFLLTIFISLPACNSIDTKDESSPFYTISPGSRLILNKTLIIQPNRANITIQNGKVVTTQKIDIYQANCSFETNTLNKTAVTIQPDTFIINKVVEETLSVSLKHQHLASNSTWQQLALLFASGPSDFNYATTMYLESKKQKDVTLISCMHWESTHDDNFLTIKQIREAMGEIFTLELI